MARVETLGLRGLAPVRGFSRSPSRIPPVLFLFGKTIAWLQPTTSIAGQPAGRAERPSSAIRPTLRSPENRSGEPPASTPVSSRTPADGIPERGDFMQFQSVRLRHSRDAVLHRSREMPVKHQSTSRPRHFPDHLHLDENALNRSGISIFLNLAKNKFIRF